MIDRRGLLLSVAALALPLPVLAQDRQLAFDGALGWAATTTGGRGGRIIKVTAPAAAGPGSGTCSGKLARRPGRGCETPDLPLIGRLP